MTLHVLTYGVAGLALLLLCSAGPMYRIGVLSLTAALMVLRWAAYVGTAAIAVSLLTGALAHRRRDRLTLAFAGAACIAGLIAVGVPLEWLRRARQVPPIHDVTTDLENPPAFVAVIPLRAEDNANSLERPASVADEQRRGYPNLAPVTLPVTTTEAFDRALAAAQGMGWLIVTADKSTGRIEATDTTFWFGFKDDVVVRLTAWGAGTRVDVRSVSRVGVNDTGTNARRIRRYLDELQ